MKQDAAHYVKEQKKIIARLKADRTALLVVSHNLAKTAAINYAIKKLATLHDDNFAVGASVILGGIQNQAKAAIREVEKG